MNNRRSPVSLKTRYLLACTLLLAVGSAQAAEISAELSRNPVHLDESFQLTFEARDTTDGEPDFSPLERDFEIRGRNQQQNIQMINGNFSKTRLWQLTLMARRSGNLTIPQIPFGNDHSPQLSIEVLEQADSKNIVGDDLYLEVETDTDTAYPGQQVLLTVRLHHAVATSNASLSTPRSDDPDMEILKLGEDQQFERQLKGRSYGVVERRYALFPQQQGAVTLEPIVFEGEVRSAGRRGGFFNSPLDTFGQPGRIRRIQSKPLQIKIKAPPPNAVTTPWLPARNLQIQDSWLGEKIVMRQGEPATRTLAIFAEGLTAAQLPTLMQKLPRGLKQYQDQPLQQIREESNGVTSVRQIKVAIVPSLPGSYTLPAIKIPWWNTVKDQPEVSQVPEIVVQVDPVAETAPATGVPQPDSAPGQPDRAPKATSAEVAPDKATGDEIPWLTLVLGFGWLTTLIAWWMWHRRTATGRGEENYNRIVPAKHGAVNKALRLACRSNDPEAASKALMEWAALRWPQLPPRSLGGIAKKLPKTALAVEISTLERHLYGYENSAWNGTKLWSAAKEQLREHPRQRVGAQQPLSPLYPE